LILGLPSNDPQHSMKDSKSSWSALLNSTVTVRLDLATAFSNLDVAGITLCLITTHDVIDKIV